VRHRSLFHRASLIQGSLNAAPSRLRFSPAQAGQNQPGAVHHSPEKSACIDDAAPLHLRFSPAQIGQNQPGSTHRLPEKQACIVNATPLLFDFLRRKSGKISPAPRIVCLKSPACAVNAAGPGVSHAVRFGQKSRTGLPFSPFALSGCDAIPFGSARSPDGYPKPARTS
jgi:hypothetical protein